MFRVTYKEVFEQSWRVLKGNFVLFLPNLFMFLIALILGIAYFWISGFYDFFVQTIALPDKAISEQLLLFVVEQWGWLLLLFLIYLVLLFCSDIFFSLTKYGMIKDVIAARKSVLKDGFAFARKHFSSSFMIHLFSVVLILLPLFFFGVLIAKFFTAITLIALFGIFVFMYLLAMLVWYLNTH